MRSTPTYIAWMSMRQRCRGRTEKDRRHYVERGITCCERWSLFENFLADVGERPAGMQLDRINNDRGYEPGNCRWVTPKENSRNRSDNTVLSHDGMKLCVQQWAEALGWPRHIISNRLRYGWTVERTLTQSPRYLKNHFARPANPAVGMNAGIEGGQ